MNIDWNGMPLFPRNSSCNKLWAMELWLLAILVKLFILKNKNFVLIGMDKMCLLIEKNLVKETVLV